MRWKIFYPVILSLLLLASCQKDPTGNKNTTDASTRLNLAYGPDVKQVMDAYLPANRTVAATKIIVLIHGGSWISGDKTDLQPYIDSLKKRLPGYAIFNLNYRLSAMPLNIFPTQENDIKAALGFIYNNAANYLISDKYVLLGTSAGGHLALLQGYKYTLPFIPKVIVSFSGPTDLIQMYNSPVGGNLIITAGLTAAIGTTPSKDSLLYARSSPINFISAVSPPTIFFQGGVDPLVSPIQAQEAHALLNEAGVANQYVFYPTAAHIGSWNNATMFDAFNKMQAFIEANVL
jgi:acetyl esterase/lipase